MNYLDAAPLEVCAVVGQPGEVGGQKGDFEA